MGKGIREIEYLNKFKSIIFILSMQEALTRQELPIQSVRERDDACTATVPVHLKILELPGDIRVDKSFIKDAKTIVRDWYNEDMAYYLGVLKQDGIDLPRLKGYEVFNDSWHFSGERDENGFLKLCWGEGSKSHFIQYVTIPIILQNQHTEIREFCTPEYCRDKGWIEIVYRNRMSPEGVNISPEKMLKYGVKSDKTRFKPKQGIVEVVANAFCSDYHTNMARTLLLRDFAVFYLNNLLSTIENAPSN